MTSTVRGTQPDAANPGTPFRCRACWSVANTWARRDESRGPASLADVGRGLPPIQEQEHGPTAEATALAASRPAGRRSETAASPSRSSPAGWETTSPAGGAHREGDGG